MVDTFPWEEEGEDDAIIFQNSAREICLKYKGISHFIVDKDGRIQINGFDVQRELVQHVNFLNHLAGVTTDERDEL